ncbi:hypothetical protein BASA83_003970 [Batrachochytrium salamandrivorans]|nr:hypothetical protein BASA83_003970 [Batrachochytrium salamandrivorans]
MGLLQQQHIPSLESSTTHTAMQQQHLQKHQTAIAAVHRCRFVQYTPSAIVSLAFAPASAKRQRYLAAARANGNIELWNPRGKSWFLERTIPGSPEAPIESVVWIPLKSSSPRLFSAGLTGLITEYDLTSLLPRHETDSFGGPIWCMAANHAQSHLAVGCEDGYERASYGSRHVRGEDTIVWDLQILQPSLGNGQTSEVIVAADSLGYVNILGLEYSHIAQPVGLDRSCSTASHVALDDSVNVWRLGDIDPTLSDFNSGQNQPIASAISADGCWIALADLYSVKVYRVILPSELSCGAFSLSNGLAKPVSGNTALPVIKRVKKVPVTGGASVLIFSPDSSRLVIAGTDSFVRVVLLGTPLDDSMQVAAVFEQHAGTNHHINRHSMNHSKASGESSKDKNERAVVILACICADSRFLATTDALNRIYVFDLESLQLHTSLPVFSSLLTCMVFHPGRVSHESTPTPTTTSPFSPPTLIFTSTTNELVMYDIGLCKAGGRMSHWSRVNSHRLPQAFVERREIVMGVCVDPAAPMRLIVWGAYMVCFIDLTVQPIDVSTTSTKSKLKGIWRSSSGSDLNHAIKKRSVEDRDCRDVDRAEGEIVLRNEPQDQSGRKLASVQVTLQKGFVVDTRYQSIMYLGFCGSQIVVVERPVLHVWLLFQLHSINTNMVLEMKLRLRMNS